MSDLQELFSRDPLQLSSQDRADIITQIRKLRVSFNTAAITANIKEPKGKLAGPSLIKDIEL